eukprot:CAMPEP_0113559722 /NCGR_PEP_ID=MMETSP0015_2-20120614/19050_1 /TAXON_ID=2838 /ORGANISM="Odontella" /LENGTH=274 /DNA_ID=CAMNT_0000461381 /DNA_START=8 /DNA_END=832 /DNA_ORIENTATION=- /assembly_acc=CAM_ASM_000160
MAPNPDAEAKKEEGNKAFASKEYAKAIEFYTAAIKIDPQNHVYYSNRSVSHAGLGKWDEAADDARECLKLDPTFIKGFYRLATAQMEMGKFDDAASTIRSGLRVDTDNPQLTRQLRMVRAKKGASEKAATSASGGGGPDSLPPGAAGAPHLAVSDPAIAKELADLQEQFTNARRDYQKVKMELTQRQHEKKRNELTVSELGTMPEGGDGGDGCNMYRSIGKMFLLTSRKGVLSHLAKEIEDDGKKEKELEGKAEFLEKRMRSQQLNIQELVRSH